LGSRRERLGLLLLLLLGLRRGFILGGTGAGL
jgi:hypothetical protein